MTHIRPLSAEEYQALLRENPEYALRVSDGSPDETYRFWYENGEFHWRNLQWTSKQDCETVHLSAVLDGDGMTQLVVPNDGESE